MDKMFNSPWFIKLISLFLALMLYTMVNMDNPSQPGGLPTITEGSYVLENVELVPYYDEENYAITEIQDSVKVNLRGPQNVLTMLQIARPSYEVYVDLQDREPGVHHVRVQHRGFPPELSVSVVPQYVRVTIQEKQTISLPVEIDLVNKGEVAEGYTIGTPIVTPVNVEITAAADQISKVAIAKGYIDVAGASSTIERSVPIKIYDEQGNELHLNIEPAVVDVRVPISSPFKTVPLKITRTGSLPEGLSLQSITPEPKEVTIYGPLEVLDKITFIEGVVVDLSKIRENTVLELTVPRPDGIERVTPEKVSVAVEVGQEEEVEFSAIPIDITGLSEQLIASFLTPINGKINVILKGTDEVLDKVTVQDVYAYIDLSQLSAGEHTVPITINGPQNINFFKSIQEARIRITDQNQNAEIDIDENQEDIETSEEIPTENEAIE
ncbi:YbbR-like domain-containing protein [Anaerobacillus sp. MEB173]|uniref:CdaR family protein n=1 Tax=Anaerobacillus sp. MEB173 TaxID=3383345 RepID=UPI003F9143DB